jgi:hypothetical protein
MEPPTQCILGDQMSNDGGLGTRPKGRRGQSFPRHSPMPEAPGYRLSYATVNNPPKVMLDEPEP